MSTDSRIEAFEEYRRLALGRALACLDGSSSIDEVLSALSDPSCAALSVGALGGEGPALGSSPYATGFGPPLYAGCDRDSRRTEATTAELTRFLDGLLGGRLAPEILRSWAAHRLQVVLDRSELDGRGRRDSVSIELLAWLVLTLDVRLSISVERRLECLEVLRAALGDGVSPRPDRLLGAVLRRLDRVCLRTQDSSWPSGSAPFPPWLEFALRPTASRQDSEEEWPVEFVPFAVFTRRFFREVLPALAPGDDLETAAGFDRFHYHPENDKGIALRELHPELSRAPWGFRYFVGPDGLAEIVLDVHALGWRERLFAVRLFALYNAIPEVVLDGVRLT